ncbi:hypothetical protein SERLA73DRAFT_115398 [Serpula lacrymans var. lacrymans S7.3]|uniref:Glucose-methanol-choline oxidoreductase N-terminal domain-containing protein n=2 Tax=Serpula lacrymans var. lacrymans TaxID=341189 RepID=F8QCR0_SERL3|nr:uncharacterized protein SERLADRAFT_418546 [Serpula lacrymans var. lacrymans S7.9]EGN93925.1 hypothetical protein SERLA73DRAFT_115398 [Serpula lacrymans var. lacrymans S7.3]EGO19298.1 hypothetical protein SERLADRAFT_418546 [Serpula lacrymans var. lacrymans S7.9]
MNRITEEYDFIIIGGGTAGCTVAGRLAELSPSLSILLVEAGKHPDGVKAISTPALAHTLIESEYDWAYKAKLIDRPDFQREEEHVTRGKVLGGSSCLNYYSWHRGSAALYDDWKAYGGDTWSWNACKSYFAKSASLKEPYNLPALCTDPGDVGENGPLNLRAVPPLPFAQDIVHAWTSRGLPVTKDIFSGSVNGLTHLISSIRNGIRTTSVAFLHGKNNISVLTQATVSRIVMEKDAASDAYIATGIELVDEQGNPRRVIRARNEVILSAGVFESPHILLLSGVGPKSELASQGIECKVDSPQVGLNLQEHPVFAQVYQVSDGRGLDHILRPGSKDYAAAQREYDETGKGPLGCALLEMSAFTRLDERLKQCKEWRDLASKQDHKDPLGPGGQPHFEYDFLPLFFPPFLPHIETPKSGDYLTVVTSLLRPSSRGTVRLTSSSPTTPPWINLNLLSAPVDLAALREGARFIKEVLERGDGTRNVVRGYYGADQELEGLNSEGVGDDVVLGHCSTGYHACGTCRIGKAGGDMEGVVDEKLRVYGVKKLRIIDASVFPVIPDGRIQSAVYMVAERGAEMVKMGWEQESTTGRVKTGAAWVWNTAGRFSDFASEMLRRNTETMRRAWE